MFRKIASMFCMLLTFTVVYITVENNWPGVVMFPIYLVIAWVIIEIQERVRHAVDTTNNSDASGVERK